MINHVRNLLMNRAKDGYSYDFPGEEYIPAAFVPRKLHPVLVSAFQQLFGTNPDRLFLNYRMRQLMAIIHATELEEFVVYYDPRVTYLPLIDDESFFSSIFGTAVTQVVGTGDEFLVNGEAVAAAGANRLQQIWDVVVTDANTLRVDKRTNPVDSIEYPLVYRNGLSDEYPLSGSSLSFRIREAPLNTRWTVEARMQPTADDIGTTIAGLETSLGDGGLQYLFPLNAQEPVATWKRVWARNPIAGYRYGAVLLAIADRVNQMPQDV